MRTESFGPILLSTLPRSEDIKFLMIGLDFIYVVA